MYTCLKIVAGSVIANYKPILRTGVFQFSFNNSDKLKRFLIAALPIGSAFYKDSSVVGQNCHRAHFPCPPHTRSILQYAVAEGVSRVPQARVS
jgi:hypothetical protein